LLLFNIHAGGTQSAGAVAGSVVGCVLLLLLLLTVSSITTCFILKRKHFILSTNRNSEICDTVGKHREANIVTEDNVAYNCKPVHADYVSNTTALEVVYDNAELTDSMEENMAYESITVDQISLGSNAAYHKSGRPLSGESDCDISYQYDYI
jgi:hypothetical protein